MTHNSGKKFKFILDGRSELYAYLQSIADEIVWDFDHHVIIPGAVYLIGCTEYARNHRLFRQAILAKKANIILEHVREGGDAIEYQFSGYLPVEDLFLNKLLPIVAGGKINPAGNHLAFDNFLTRVHLEQENISAMKYVDAIFDKKYKPYKFLFLNGRPRPHRKYLLERFKSTGLLDQAIWSNLGNYYFLQGKPLKLQHQDIDLIKRPLPIQCLSTDYEHPAVNLTKKSDNSKKYVKDDLFNNQWLDGIIYPPPYVDTYFSLITETVFDCPYTFRTEKIWKPITIGHPWIAVSGYGFYRDLKNLGFRTFGHLIDETFDLTEDNQKRIERIADVVEDLCQQNLEEFLAAAKETCKYNQQLCTEFNHRVVQDLPNQFIHFVNKVFYHNS